MRKFNIFLAAFSGSLICHTAYAQSNNYGEEIKIDPRQYVTVQYRKTPTEGKLDTIWNWENRKTVPSQKFHFIDVEGEVKIDFSRKGLMENKEFEGTVSLEAEISGLNGTRKIEVNPYSEIGVQRIPIGIKSEPPSEIAKKLLNMIRELREADSIYNFISIYRSFSTDYVETRKVINDKTKELYTALNDKNVLLDNIVPDALYLEGLILNNTADTSFYKLNLSKDKKDLKSKVDNMIRSYNYYYNEDRTNYINHFRAAFTYATKKSDIILEYLSSFENGGEDATKAFMSLVNKDLISFKALKNGFILSQKKLSQIDINFKEADNRLDSVLLANANVISETCKSLAELSRFKGSMFERILTELPTYKSYSIDKSRYPTQVQVDEEQKRIYFDLIDRYIEELSERLSLEAGRMIYKKLVYAIIDLGKSGAKNGEVLNVYLTWILNSKRDSLANSPRLPIGKYYLRETGWKVEIADMFAMIKRRHESVIDKATVSPSNFKGSGGAVLMLTYHKQDKGLSVKPVNGMGYKVNRKGKFMNFLEPSFGLNISYLDFSTEKDVEIGTGVQLGLLRNKVFFGYGLNLHMLSPKNQSPSYFFIGFSFARLSDFFKDSGSIKAN